jgi:hypothetical protein
MKAVLAGLIFVWLTGPALAADEDALWCRNGAFPSYGDFHLTHVTGKVAYFLDDNGMDHGCPEKGPPVCGKLSAKTGVPVLFNKSHGAYVCALDPRNGNGGWVEKAQLGPAEPVEQAPSLTAWKGTWVWGDDSLTLDVKGGRLAVDGEAFWPSRDYPTAHEGSVGGDAVPRGNHVVFTDGDCRLTATLVGSYLAVSDNHNCGGMNVNFDGVYHRKIAVKARGQ